MHEKVKKALYGNIKLILAFNIILTIYYWLFWSRCMIKSEYYTPWINTLFFSFYLFVFLAFYLLLVPFIRSLGIGRKSPIMGIVHGVGLAYALSFISSSLIGGKPIAYAPYVFLIATVFTIPALFIFFVLGAGIFGATTIALIVAVTMYLVSGWKASLIGSVVVVYVLLITSSFLLDGDDSWKDLESDG